MFLLYNNQWKHVGYVDLEWMSPKSVTLASWVGWLPRCAISSIRGLILKGCPVKKQLNLEEPHDTVSIWTPLLSYHVAKTVTCLVSCRKVKYQVQSAVRKTSIMWKPGRSSSKANVYCFVYYYTMYVNWHICS